jgi:hypothetical protein
MPDKNSTDWRGKVLDFFGHGLRSNYFIADIERLLLEHRALVSAYDSEEPADTHAAVLDILDGAEALVRALRNPRAASWIAQGAMLAGVEDLTRRLGALVVASNAALDEFGPPPRRGAARQHPRLMFVVAVARAYVDHLGDDSATPETCLRDLDFVEVFEGILSDAGIPASNPGRLLAQAFPRV